MSVKLVQQVTGNISASAASMTAALATTKAGNFLVAYVGTTATTDVTTTLSTPLNTFVKIGAGVQYSGGGAGFIVLYYVKNINGETSPTVTMAHSGTISATMVIAEYSGIDKVSPLDQSKYAGGTLAAVTTGASGATGFGPAGAAELVVAAVSSDFGNNTFTLGSGYSNLKSVGNANSDGAMEDKLIYASAAQTGTFTMGNASDNAAGVVTFFASPERFNNSGLRPHPFSPGLAR